MTIIPILDVDYYRNLLANDPSAFLNIIEKQNFGIIMESSLRSLVREVEEVIRSSEEEHQPMLIAKLIVASGMKDRTSDQMRYEVSNSPDPRIQAAILRKKLIYHELYLKSIHIAEEAELRLLEREYAKTPFLSGERPQLFFFVYMEGTLTSFKKISMVCTMMKVHKRLTKMIEETPFFKARMKIINPNQVQTMSDHTTDLLDLHGTSAADNNSNNCD